MDTSLFFFITMFAGDSDLMVGIHPQKSPRYPRWRLAGDLPTSLQSEVRALADCAGGND